MSSGFVSEADLEERRRVRKEMWQSNKRDSDPDEPPDEPAPDNRSLFDRLKEQKDKKQEEWEEAHKLKNMVRGLEDDEVDFLEFVDDTKLKEEKRIRQEEFKAIEEYRKKVAEMQHKAIESDVRADMKPKMRHLSEEKKKTSQISLLAGAIKRKKSGEEDQAGDENKKAKLETSPEKEQEEEENNTKEKGTPKYTGSLLPKSALQCVAILPGLGVYTDSSDSDNDSNSDSDLGECSKLVLPRDITGRIIHFDHHHRDGCC